VILWIRKTEAGKVPIMTIGRTLLTAVILSTLGGCAQQGPIQSHLTTVRGLKASVSQLEFERNRLEKKVAELDAKNQEIGDRLVQEEADRDNLATRLDNARGELRRRGVELGDASDASDDEDRGPSKTLPAANSPRKKRKTPVARIPARIETIPSSDGAGQNAAEDEGDSATHGDGLGFSPRSRPENDDHWLPVARSSGTGKASTTTR